MKALDKLRARRVEKVLEKLRTKGEQKEIFRIPYVETRLSVTTQWRYFGDLVFTDKAICFLSTEKFRVLTYDNPSILVMYIFFVGIGSVILESIGRWGMVIGGGIGAIAAGVVHDQLRKRNREKIKMEIAKIIRDGKKLQMEDIITFFWRENVTELQIADKKIYLSWLGKKPIEYSMHGKHNIDSLEQQLTDYLKPEQERILE